MCANKYGEANLQRDVSKVTVDVQFENIPKHNFKEFTVAMIVSNICGVVNTNATIVVTLERGEGGELYL